MVDPIVTTDRQVMRHGRAEVSIADALRDQEFTLVPYLRCEELRLAVAPEIDQARLTYVYGDIVREDAFTVAQFTPQSLNGKFVRVVAVDTVYEDAVAADPETEEQDLTIVWHGYVQFDEAETMGTTPDPDNHPQGLQQFVAFGLARLLELQQIRTSIVDIDGTAENQMTVAMGLPFNADPSGQFLRRGNQSQEKVGDSYLFSWEPRGTQEWTAYTAAEYLLAHQSPKQPDGNVANRWRLESNEEFLNWYDISESTDGLTVKEVLDRLIPRQRAVSYWIYFDTTRTDPEDPETAANEIVVKVFTFVKSDITLPNGGTLKANPNQKSLDFETALDIRQATVTNASVMYHRVIARGARRTTTFTARITRAAAADWQETDILGAAWSPADEGEYTAAASSALDYLALDHEQKTARNAAYRRSTDRLREVFRRFVVNPAKPGDGGWNCEIKHPHKSGDYPTWWLRGDQSADPFTAEALDDAGEYVDAEYDGRDYVHALRVQRALPLYEQQDYSGGNLADFSYGTAFANRNPSFIPLLVYARTKSGTAEWAAGERDDPHRYEVLDRLNAIPTDGTTSRDWSCQVGVSDTEPGIELTASRPHFLGGALAGEGVGWAATADEDLSRLHGGINYPDIWVTLCIQLSEHAERERSLTAANANAPENVLIIHVPNAHHDYVVPGTTVEIRDGIPIESTTGGAARDDLAKLDSVALAAAQWYSVRRQALRLNWSQLRGLFQLGWLITDVGGRYQLTDVNTPITAITYNFGSEHSPDGGVTNSASVGATTIETGFTNLDFTG